MTSIKSAVVDHERYFENDLIIRLLDEWSKLLRGSSPSTPSSSSSSNNSGANLSRTNLEQITGVEGERICAEVRFIPKLFAMMDDQFAQSYGDSSELKETQMKVFKVLRYLVGNERALKRVKSTMTEKQIYYWDFKFIVNQAPFHVGSCNVK